MSDWIDAHVHVWTDDRERFPRAEGEPDYQPARFTPENFLEHSLVNGVTRAVLVQMSFYGHDHSYLLETMRAHPGKFAGIGVLDLSEREPSTGMVQLAGFGLRGFRIAPGPSPRTWLDGPAMAAMWRCGAERGLALCPLVNADALEAIDHMCSRFPDTPVVIDHMARIGVDGSVRDTDVRLLCSLSIHPRVYVKISAFYALGRKRAPYTDLAPLIRRVFDAFGPTRLMWGSDCPFQVQESHTYKESLGLIVEHLQFLSPGDRAWLLSKTAEGLFFHPPLTD